MEKSKENEYNIRSLKPFIINQLLIHRLVLIPEPITSLEARAPVVGSDGNSRSQSGVNHRAGAGDNSWVSDPGEAGTPDTRTLLRT